MHLAVVATSTYEENEAVAVLPVSEPNQFLIRERLGRPDAGFRVDTMEADSELPELLHERLSFFEEPLESLVVYFSGYAVAKPSPGAALLLDGPKLSGVPLGRLFRTLESASRNTLVVLDVAAVVVPGQTPAGVAEAMADAVPSGGRVSCLLAARDAVSHPVTGPSPFTDLLILSLDWLAWEQEPVHVTASRLYEAMQAERAAFSRVGSAAFRTGLTDFPLCPGAIADGTLKPSLAANAPPPAPSWSPTALPAPQGAALPSFDLAVGPGPPTLSPAGPASSAPPATGQLPPSSAIPTAPKPPDIPTTDTIAAEARQLVEAGHFNAALEAYDRALLFCDPDDAAARSALLVDVGVALRTAERAAEALPKLHEALALDPQNARAVAHVSDVLRATRDYAGIEQLKRRFLEGAVTSEERGAVLYELATMWLEEAGDRPNGVRLLRELLELFPDDRQALALLVRALDGLGDPEALIEPMCRLAELTEEPKKRETRFADVARRCIDDLDDFGRAMLVAQRACRRDPKLQGAVSVVANALAKRESWVDLAILYEFLVEQMPRGADAAAVLTRLGEIYRDHVGHEHRGLQAFERALAIDGRNVALRFDLASLYQSRGLTRKAVEHLRGAVSAAPGEPEGYRRLLGAFESLGIEDGVWNAASALTALGSADAGEAELANAGRSDGLIDVDRGLTEEDWQAGLLHAPADADLSTLFSVVADAAVADRIKALAKEKEAFVPDPSTKQDVEKSTATMVKSLVWTARLLGTPVPDLYIYPKVKRSMLTLPVEKPTTLASRALGSGLSLEQLCFLWGRHLAFFRPEHRVMIYYSTTRELASLTLVALTLGKSAKPDLSALDKRARQLAKALKRELGDEGLRRLRDAVEAFPKRGASERVFAWVRRIELVAGRLGLLACGDCTIAVDLIRRFPAGGMVSENEQVDDVLAYSVSEDYLALRERIGASSSLIKFSQ